nr:uncharacterized protein LOC105478841 isoform X2 [Macaca nemestrina]
MKPWETQQASFYHPSSPFKSNRNILRETQKDPGKNIIWIQLTARGKVYFQKIMPGATSYFLISSMYFSANTSTCLKSGCENDSYI